MIEWLLGQELGPAGRLDWASPQWVVTLAVGAALLVLLMALRGERSWLARLGELGALGLALAGLVVALARPMWIEEEGRLEPGRVAVLVDGSRSMSILEAGRPRSEQAEAILDRLDASDVDFYTFGDDLRVGRPSAYDLPGTDLEGALDALSERLAGDRPAAVVVVSDGLDRGLLRRRFQQEERPVPPAIPAPLTVYQVGSVGDLKDLAVRGVRTGGYAFVRSPFHIRANIEGVGYGRRAVPVTLTVDGEVVTTRRVTLGEDGRAEAVFEVVPERAGRFTYTVSVPTFEDDAVPGNNSESVVVRVVRDRIRVLQVAGRPTWDVKFLRRFLKGDPSVDLVSFFILRTRADMAAPYEPHELSLIEFPHRRLFSEDLTSFDLVVLQNFDHAPYFQWESDFLLRNMRDYVARDGFALAMIGGDLSFDMGAYGGTPLAEVLPLRLGLQGTLADEAPFRPELTEQGRRHPITRLAPDPEENEAWWSRLHPADGTNLTLGAAPDAAVLLTHPTQRTRDGEPMPVLAVREAGEGRTMALTIDASWRWSFSEAAEGRGNQAYLRFWKNAMRWLIGDPTTERVEVETGRENYAVGDTVRMVVRARDPGFAPLSGARVEVVIQGEGGRSRLEGRTGPDGEAVLEWPADRRGAQRVRASVRSGDERVGEAESVFAVTTRDPELDEVVPDEGFLRWLAEATDGRYHAPGEWGPVLRDPEAGRTVWDRREATLWNAPGLALWIALFSGLAWIIRRRAGLR